MSWYAVPNGSWFGLEALPYGVFAPSGGKPRVGARIGAEVVDLAAVAERLGNRYAAVLAQPTLNPLLALGGRHWAELRHWVRSLFEDAEQQQLVREHLHPLEQAQLRLPFEVADYVDFYASESHAGNVGRIFRPDSPALPANWKHLPIGYHGRAGTVVVSGTDVVRPCGQRRPAPGDAPPFGPSTTLDIECEVGFVVGGATPLGSPVSVSDAADHIFGVVLLNDWSARDIQAWEYVPLGPFLGKSFATSISAWVLPLEALSAARVNLPPQEPPVLRYLQGDEPGDVFGLDLHLEVELGGSVVSRPEFKDMYWSPAQMLAHLTVNGASLRDGDLFASGTVSGWSSRTYGSLLERTWNGSEPLTLDDGTVRAFLEDGDTVTLRGWAAGVDGGRVGLGEVTGTVLPARQ